MLESVLEWGTLAGLIHFVAVGILYGNPIIDKMYKKAAKNDPAVKSWASQPKYLVTQFLGTQIEVFVIAIGYFWLRPLVSSDGATAVLLLGTFFAALRVYPRFWNMWIQSTYPTQLLKVEFVNGVISTFVIVAALQLLSHA